MADQDICSKCGFAAKARIKDILAARKAVSTRSDAPSSGTPHGPTLPHTPDAFERLAIELGPLPPWRQVIAGLGLVTAFVGGIYLKVMLSWTESLVGLIALVAGGMVYIAAVHAGREAKPSNVRSINLDANSK